MSGPLTGYTVIDMSRYIAGPYCSMLLGDLGANVIKVERRAVGEDSRGLLPFKKVGDDSVSLYFTQYNKNKRSLTVDFRNPESIELLKKLIAKADVLVENFRAGTMDKMGLSKEALKEINPSLVVTHISGFGQDGPYKDRAAFDCIGQAMGGLMGVTGENGGDPLLVGTWAGDFTTAIYAAYGTVSALLHKEKTGEGQHLDLSLVECTSTILATAIPNYVANGVIQPRRGNRDDVTGPANLFKCKDGNIYLHAGTDPLFKRLCKAMGKPEIAEDERYNVVAKRMKCIEEVEAIVQQWIGNLTTNEAEAALVEVGVPVTKIADVSDIVNNPMLQHREAIGYVEYPGVGEIAVPGICVKMSGTPGEIRYRPPLLGEHNEEILKEYLNLSDDEIKELYARKII